MTMRLPLFLFWCILYSVNAFATPTVSLTAPTNGNLYLAPATFAVKANASSPGATVVKVEFYADGNLINTDTASPYQFDWTNVAAGTYSITAKVVDSNGAEATSAARTVTVAATNTPPTVSLSAPADNARYLNPASITLSATAAGPELNDLLQSVAFYANGTLVGTATSAPYNVSWSSPALGSYTLTAVATDGQGATTTSAARAVTVSDQNQAPTVSIVTPLNNTLWHSPASLSFSANASAVEANDIVQVQFFVNGSLAATDTTAPYSTMLSNLAAGTYTLMARAIDGQGAQTDSATRTITVSDTNANPTVSITAPSGGTNYPSAPAGFTLTATAGAGEVNGWVTKVEFYINGQLVNTDNSGPWSYAVTGLANGTYSLTAKAFDQLNAETTAAPVTITVGPQAKLAFIHVDHLGAPREVYDDQQRVVWRNQLQEPFGDGAPDEDPTDIGIFQFPLVESFYYADKETGTRYAAKRDAYDPSIGRFIQADPLGIRLDPAGFVEEPSLYAYVGSNPLSLVDPTGEAANVLIRAGAAAIAVCLKIKACREATEVAMKTCKNLRCKFDRHPANHHFSGLGYCEHYQLVCWIEGGPRLFRNQWPLPGTCRPNRNGPPVPGGATPDVSDAS